MKNILLFLFLLLYSSDFNEEFWHLVAYNRFIDKANESRAKIMDFYSDNIDINFTDNNISIDGDHQLINRASTQLLNSHSIESIEKQIISEWENRYPVDSSSRHESLFLHFDQQTEAIELEEISVELTDWHPSSIPFPKTRDAWEWPFSQESIWNLPLGNNAVYEPAHLETGFWTSADVELVYQVSEDDPLTRLYAPGSWTHRCSGTNSPTGNPGDSIYIRFPEDELVSDANPPHTPNNVTSILQPDGETIVSVAPLARCEEGGPVYGWYFGEESLYGAGITGGHGGSRLSGFGGSIRLGELIDNEPIRHALKINVFANQYLHYDDSDSTPGYRWPASRADSYAAANYQGDNPNFEMGSLLAIPQHVTPESLGINSLPALKLFHALQDYGAYVVDDTAWNVTAFNVQEGVKEEFRQTYGYDFSTNNHNSQWFQEYYTLVENLHLVTNNSPSSPGGGGSRSIPLAPPL